MLLRTHTSPMQVRAMEAQEPPIYIVVPGRVYRRDTPDATHVPMFHQLEGLAIDEDITLADLQGVLLAFARADVRRATPRCGCARATSRSPSRAWRWTCPASAAAARATEGASRCSTCKGEGWIEILGSGMVDPNVLDYVADNGYDTERVQGFAFGMGIERIAMLVHEVPDLRMLFENDAAPAGAVRRMRVPVAWLRAYCDPGMPAEEIADALTMAGAEARARCTASGWGTSPSFVIGKVLSAEPHPDADRLTRLRRWTIGAGAPSTIVCGAPNVAAGPDRGGGAARAR